MINLFINNQLVDIGNEKDFSIKLNRTFTDVNQINSRQGDFSYTARIPKTKTNNEIFKNINIVNTLDKFISNEDLQARLETGGNNSIDGFLKLTKITENSYEFVLISNNIAWAKLLEGKNLPDLKNVDGSAWEAMYVPKTGSTVQYSLPWYVENANYDNSDICFPLIPRGHFFHSANTSLNFIYDDSLTFNDIPPAVYKGKITKKIFENIGWNVDGDVLNDTEQKKLFLPFVSGDKYRWSYYATRPYAIAGIHAPADNTSPTNTLLKNTMSFKTGFTDMYWIEYDNSYVDIYNEFQPFVWNDVDNVASHQSYEFVPYQDSPFEITLNTETTTTPTDTLVAYKFPSPYTVSGNVKVVVMIYIHDDSLFDGIMADLDSYLSIGGATGLTHPNIILAYDVAQSYFQGTQISWQPYDSAAPITITDNLYKTWGVFASTIFYSFNWYGNLELKVNQVDLFNSLNQKIRAAIVYQSTDAASTTTHALYNGIGLKSSKFSFNPLALSGQTSNLVITDALPPISQLDFLKEYFTLNNCYLSYDQDLKVVRFDTFDSFFLPNDKAYDITEKVDLKNNQPSISPMKLPRNIFYKYSNDEGDYLIKQDKDYGNLQVASDNLGFTSGNQTLQSLFSATRTRDYVYFSGATYPINVTLPCIMSEADANIYDNTMVQWEFNSSSRILKTDGFATDVSGNTVYINIDGFPCKILLSRFEDTTDGNLNLRFDGDNGLYQTFYSRYLNQIADSHIVEYESETINTLDYNRMLPQYPIKVDNQHYFLNEINGFNPIKPDKTKIQLIKKFTN